MASHVMMNQLWCRIPNAISAKNTYLPIAQMYVVAFQIARMGATMKVYRPSDQFGQCISKNVRRWTCLIRMRTAKPADVEYRVAIGNRRVRVRRKVCEVSQLSCLTEGFYDTRPQRSGRCKCHEHHTKGSRLEQKSRVCRCLHGEKCNRSFSTFPAKRFSM